MELPGHGAIRYIEEILQDPSTKSVRTFGFLSHVSGNTFTAEFRDRRLQVDASLLGEQLVIKDGSLYMMIGEVETSEDRPTLRVRVARNVDGMDLNLFDAALSVRRKFEAELKA
ncbi:hypothetical protein GUITHDRAFT_134546 [Guillardia theta CCMP2712]|uniref:Uncharacterized protein n=1 Tax=Guillardia theta (strain CCMP2712) TaxID=905079 RepID=L1JSV9_GUITC|nr:hypothetical protein GUITHDRAFT_134546 [Guillardia theta CCMP2712]EKX51656.1 hypothetical protein GUITHDRAFT_134546 [Guillardia theta CCMP2712]|mmetsp:Transcript_44342/g.139901  ORF Transcript_44342/g.139901 Transcript_44342/m.139901 type:complete len:114 (-) Transcript_44342:2562-2903(-)|eukprot:XP_005838636.1 hypothetical protein GUITHDRAFT_134546 [Guillardia theta CCMP2712]